jgi:hypothetical protein
VVTGVANSSALQKLSLLNGASQFLSGPFLARMKEEEQRCGTRLDVQQTLQLLQQYIDSAKLVEHFGGVIAAAQHLKLQLEDMHTKNSSTLTDAQLLQVWSAAQHEQGRAARAELASVSVYSKASHDD